jgi:hypothetical protein
MPYRVPALMHGGGVQPCRSRCCGGRLPATQHGERQPLDCIFPQPPAAARACEVQLQGQRGLERRRLLTGRRLSKGRGGHGAGVL